MAYDFTDLLRSRRSTRKYAPEPLEADDVVQLMEAALLAPSSKNKRPCEYILVDDRQKLEALSQCKNFGAAMLREAPLGIVVCARIDVSDVWIEDASVAATTLLYQAEALGLGACWVQVRERGLDDDTPAAMVVRSVLGLPAEVEPLAIISVGRKLRDNKPHDDEPAWEKVHTNGWSNDVCE